MANIPTEPSTSANVAFKRDLDATHKIASGLSQDSRGEFKNVDPGFSTRYANDFYKGWLTYYATMGVKLKRGKKYTGKKWREMLQVYDLRQRELLGWVQAWNRRVEKYADELRTDIQKEKARKAKKKEPKVKKNPGAKKEPFVGPPLPPGYLDTLTRNQKIAIGVGGGAALLALGLLGSRK